MPRDGGNSAELFIPETHIAMSECDWEQILDMMGTRASFDALENHLRCAPNPQSPMAQYLSGYLANKTLTA